MNDIVYAADIQRCLIAMAGTLFESQEREMVQAGRRLVLDDQEIEDMVNDNSGGTP